MMKKMIFVHLIFGISVFGVAEAQSSRFTRSTDVEPVVSDSVTKLVWQGCPAGLTEETCGAGTVLEKTWKDALVYCEELVWGGKADWRLPNRKELLSIVDHRKVDPAVDSDVFPKTPGSYFWSSSSYAGNATIAWSVTFGNGLVNSYSKTSTTYVRCVRSGP